MAKKKININSIMSDEDKSKWNLLTEINEIIIEEYKEFLEKNRGLRPHGYLRATGIINDYILKIESPYRKKLHRFRFGNNENSIFNKNKKQ